MRKYLKTSMFLLIGFLFCVDTYSQTATDVKKSTSGLGYQLYKIGKDTIKPRIGDWISLDMQYATKIDGKDTLLFDNKTQLQGAPVRFQLPPSDFPGDLYAGIRMLSPGDSGTFFINADSLFLKTFKMEKRPESIPDNSTIKFNVSLLSIDNPVKMKKQAEDAMQKYLADNKITVQPTASGVYIVPSVNGEGIKIDTGCMVKLHLTVSLIDGKQVFSSYETNEPIKCEYGTKFGTPGIEEAIAKMKKGEKAKVVVPYEKAFGEVGRGAIVPPYAPLIYDVEILDVQSKADYEKAQTIEKQKEMEKKAPVINNESMLLDKYLTDNKITVKPTASGLYYIEKTKGTGPRAVAGKTVKVHYTGTLVNGTKFDSSRDRNQPFGFTIGKGMVIPGWDEGIAMMEQGGKAVLIIPSKLAYGDRDMGEIAPYSTLIFDVELLEVK